MHNLLFYPSFFLLFLLSVFLIEGEYKFYLFAAWAGWLVVFGQQLQGRRSDLKHQSQQAHQLNQGQRSRFAWLQLVSTNFTVVCAFVLSVLFMLNLLTSQNLPLTLEKLVFYLISLALLIFFLGLPRQKFSVALFFYYLALSSLVLNLFVLFFTFVNFPSDLFPAMNMLVRVFGHNYYAAYLLLVLPVFWWQFLYAGHQEHLFDRQLMRYLSLGLIFSSYLLLFFSLARWSILVGFLQLLAIFWLNKAAFIKLLHNQFAYAVLRAFLLVLFVLIALFVSLPIFFGREQACPLNFTYKEMCKPLLSNDRWQYWQKAIWIWQSQPLFGTGLKTFGFASRQFVLPDYNYSAYAHNIFLHNLAEGGLVVGVTFALFIIYLLWKAWRINSTSQDELLQFLLLAVLASWFNAMFDLTWNFFVIFTLTLIFLALIVREEQTTNQLVPINFSKWHRSYSWFLMISTFILATAYALAAALLHQQRQADLIRWLPFFDPLVRSLAQQRRLNADEFRALHRLYYSDPDFIARYAALLDLDEKQRAIVLLELNQLDPILFVKNLDLRRLNPSVAKPVVDSLLGSLQQYHMINNTKLLDYWQQRNLAADIFHLANQAYQQDQIQLAAQLYQQAMQLNPYIMSDLRPAFLDEQNLDQSSEFFLVFQNQNPESSQDFNAYMSLYQRSLLHLFRQDRLDEFLQLVNNARLAKNWHHHVLAADIFHLANQAYQQDQIQLAAQLYQQAMQLNPYIMSDLRPAFLDEQNLDQSSEFFLVFQNQNPESSQDFNAYMSLYQRSLLHLFRQDRLDEFLQLTEHIVELLPNHAWFVVRDLLAIATPSDRDKLQQVHEYFPEWSAWADLGYQVPDQPKP